MDATFACVRKGWSFYVILTVDGEGNSVVAAYFLIRDNSFKSLFPVFEILNKLNDFSKCQFFY